MKGLKLSLVVLTAILFIGMSGMVYAFHSGGVAECEGCHTMHNSHENTKMSFGANAGPYLLKGSDQSSTCIECHGETPLASSYHMVTPDASMPAGTPPGNYTPGGDFGWLKKTYTWVPRSGAATETSKGERKGHNIIATDFSYVADAANTTAPGGTYPGGGLGCQSCHDPHGRYRRDTTGAISTTGLPIRASGSYYNTKSGVSANEPNSWSAVGVYRLLGGVGYTPKSLGSNAFTENVPVAKVNSTYQGTAGEATTQYRVAYGSNMSQWCSNCHGNMHRPSYTSGTPGLTHPSGAPLTAAVVANYNAYKKSGDMTGVVASSGNNLIPFETGSTDYTALASLAVNTATFAGPDTSAQVMCLSCHRAHASGFDSMLRFSYLNEFMTVADSAGNPIWPDITANPGQAQGRTATEIQAAYMNRPVTQFAPYQRALCNKCHAKD